MFCHNCSPDIVVLLGYLHRQCRGVTHCVCVHQIIVIEHTVYLTTPGTVCTICNFIFAKFLSLRNANHNLLCPYPSEYWSLIHIDLRTKLKQTQCSHMVLTSRWWAWEDVTYVVSQFKSLSKTMLQHITEWTLKVFIFIVVTCTHALLRCIMLQQEVSLCPYKKTPMWVDRLNI